MLGIAQTGTGKTAAFSLPILNWLSGEPCKSRSRRPYALILSPTRELAIQIGESLATYGRHLNLRSCTIFGGVGQSKQVNQLRQGSHILVATPGRLLDLMSQGHVYLDCLEIFVLDEADRMLDMGFLPSLKRILRELPEERQSLFFSATLPTSIKTLANELLHDPASVRIAPESVSVEKIDQRFVLVQKGDKQRVLKKLLAAPDVDRAVVFTRTKRGANRLSQQLEKCGVRAVAIHGNKSQSARQSALAAFRSNKVQVLVATDVAARGIDIQGISHVVNYDLPSEPESYVHRIGRTGRAGADGVAISFCLPEEKRELRAIEKLTGKKARISAATEDSLMPKGGSRARRSESGRIRDDDQRPPKRKKRSSENLEKANAPRESRSVGSKPETSNKKRKRNKVSNGLKTAATTDNTQQSRNRKGVNHRKKQQHLSEEKTRDGKEAKSTAKKRKTRGKKKTRRRTASRA